MNRSSTVFALIVSSIAAFDIGDVCPIGGNASVIADCHFCIDTCMIQAILVADCLEDASDSCGGETYDCGCPEKTPGPVTSAPETPTPETQAPETLAPETPAPETPAPETPRPTPSCTPAYDDYEYCLCPAPTPSPTYPEKIEVSVCGDATYLLDHDQVPCSGPVSKDPAGTACPKKGDTTTIACRDEILSYLTGGKTGTCKAPEDATCEKLNTGAWGCVFPGNCNTVNTCLEQPVCTDEYEKDANGTCIILDNGYVKPAANNTALYDTTALSELQQKVATGSASTLMISATVLFSGIALFF